MSDENDKDESDLNAMRLAFGKVRKRTFVALEAVRESSDAFVAAHGERLSISEMMSNLPQIVRQMESIQNAKITQSVIAKAYRACTDIKDGLQPDKIIEDMTEEAAEDSSAAGDAAKLISALEELDKAQHALLAACEAFGDFAEDLETGATTMAQSESNSDDGGSAPRPLRATGRGSSQIKRNTVASQLVSTLDRLGLPHSYGTLELEDDADGRMTDQLVRALNDRFEVFPTDTGERVRKRQRPIGGFTVSDDVQSGRIVVDAQAIGYTAEQLGATLDGIENQLRFVERPGLSLGAPRTRQLVDRRLEEIRSLAASPQGIPALQIPVKYDQVQRETFEYLEAIGIDVNGDAREAVAKGDDRFELATDSDSVISSEGPVNREEVEAEVREVCRLLCLLAGLLNRAARTRSKGEIGYRIERSLERAMVTARTTLDLLGSVEMVDTLNLWESEEIEIKDSRGVVAERNRILPTQESLGNGIAESLRWLVDVSQPYVEGDREIERLSRTAAQGLADELMSISKILSASTDVLDTYDLEGTAEDISVNVAGLAKITERCARFAEELRN